MSEAQEMQNKLNDISEKIERESQAKRIFISIPNLNDLCVGLVNKLFHFAMQRKYNPWFHFATEKRHTDYARNCIADEFMKSGCDALLMIDADVDPHPDSLSMIELDKDIIAGNIFCWIRGELMSSIWQRAECEQCRNLKTFMEEGKVHDPSQYIMTERDEQDGVPAMLRRWNPFNGSWDLFAATQGMLSGKKCRCKGTGMDPFVFRTHQHLTKEPLKVDSVGSAAMMIQRRVFEKMEPPYFRFLYKPSREILLTEDHYFCWKAQEFGFEVWAAPNMFGSHYKTVDLLQLSMTLNKAFEAGRQRGQMEPVVAVPELVAK
jgi:hypothetical protein